MRWFEFTTSCVCGESEAGFVPSEERFNIRCDFCSRYQKPILFGRVDDDMDYEEYLDMLEEEEEFEYDEDEDWDW